MLARIRERIQDVEDAIGTTIGIDDNSAAIFFRTGETISNREYTKNKK